MSIKLDQTTKYFLCKRAQICLSILINEYTKRHIHAREPCVIETLHGLASGYDDIVNHRNQ